MFVFQQSQSQASRRSSAQTVHECLNEQPEVMLVVLEFSVCFAIKPTDKLGAFRRNCLIHFYDCRIRAANRLDTNLRKPLHHGFMEWGYFAALEVIHQEGPSALAEVRCGQTQKARALPLKTIF